MKHGVRGWLWQVAFSAGGGAMAMLLDGGRAQRVPGGVIKLSRTDGSTMEWAPGTAAAQATHVSAAGVALTRPTGFQG